MKVYPNYLVTFSTITYFNPDSIVICRESFIQFELSVHWALVSTASWLISIFSDPCKDTGCFAGPSLI